MPKKTLKDKVDGNALDLSMSQLYSPPVDEMMSLKKVTDVDLSCNLLSTLPETFCNLAYIEKLDLSKNQIMSLPTQFGNLTNLRHLDLWANKLTMLPLSFYNLHNLKWLDVKDNPLDSELMVVAGDCLDNSQCRTCAQKVLKYIKSLKIRIENAQRRELEIEQEAEKQKKHQEFVLLQKKKAKIKSKRHKAFLKKQRNKENEECIVEPLSYEIDEMEEHVNVPAADKSQVSDFAPPMTPKPSYIFFIASFIILLSTLAIFNLSRSGFIDINLPSKAKAIETLNIVYYHTSSLMKSCHSWMKVYAADALSFIYSFL